MSPGKAVVTSRVDPLYVTTDGIVLGISKITAIAALTALVTDGEHRFAPGCLIVCVNANVAASVLVVYNTGTATAPSFTGMIS
jgi:hypothetical protein